jgi:predicted TIM-barrel fold metal-dependent hydrolase
MRIGSETAPAPCPPPRPSAAPRHAPPPGAWDAHTHVVGPPPWVSPRNFDPPTATAEAYLHHLDTLGMAYGVLVQVSVHGTDNRLMVEALEANPGRLRGVAAITPDTPPAELRRLHAAGVRGARVLTLARGGVTAEDAPALARLVAPLGWHLEFGVHREDLMALRPLIDALPTPVVVAHFGGSSAGGDAGEEAAAAVLGMLERPDRYVKLSAPYHFGPPPWTALAPFAQALARRAPHGLLWGSDWPHVGVGDAADMPATQDLLDVLVDWIPDPQLRHAILVDNPARLYGLPG